MARRYNEVVTPMLMERTPRKVQAHLGTEGQQKRSRARRFLFASVLCLLAVTLFAQRVLLSQHPDHRVVPRPAVIAPQVKTLPGEVRFAAVGDSYTIGQGVSPDERWPGVLSASLSKNAVPNRVVANAAHTGWTTQDVLDSGLPLYEQSHPTFATLQIGVNDWVQGVAPDQFRANLVRVIERMLTALPDRRRLLLVTIPDFSVTPGSRTYTTGRDASGGIRAFNSIIIEEARRHHLPVVDIFFLSQEMKHPAFVTADGLHPSASEYRRWARQIFPVARRLLQATAPPSSVPHA